LITALAFSRDGRRLASGCMDATIRVWDTTTGEETLPSLKSPMGSNAGIAFSPDGRRLASCGNGLQIWEATTGQEILWLTGHQGGDLRVAFSPDGHRLVSAGEDGVLLWDARPLTPEGAGEREAWNLLAFLVAKPLCKEDVIEFLNTSQTITSPVRQRALSLVDRYPEESDPEKYHQAAWSVARQRYLNDFQYGFAHRQAEMACRKAPENGRYLTALGVAQYRANRYRDALDTLKRADQRDNGNPVVLAFRAMAQLRLGLNDQADLEQLRQTMQKPEWAANEEVQGSLQEAEAVLRGTVPEPKR
jgi:hypothetical protein